MIPTPGDQPPTANAHTGGSNKRDAHLLGHLALLRPVKQGEGKIESVCDHGAAQALAQNDAERKSSWRWRRGQKGFVTTAPRRGLATGVTSADLRATRREG